MIRVGAFLWRSFTPALAVSLAFSSLSCTADPTTPGGSPTAHAGNPTVHPGNPQPPQTAAPAPLSADDVSWLFPPPTRAEDFGKLISVRDLTAPNPQDPTKREALVTELAALRTQLNDGKLGADKVTTSNVPLGVHPGLTDATTADQLRQRIKSFLEAHISGQRLDAMAVAGLPAGLPEPWIFLSMVKVPPGVTPSLPNGGFIPVHGPTLDGQQFAQMLSPEGVSPRVVPAPQTNNLNPITCKNAAVSSTSLPATQRTGVATADVLGVSGLPNEKITHILDTVADPTRSHFFNTDCISCHTETRAAMDLLSVKTIPGIDPAALPNGSWDVRNFGWAPAANGSFQATVTRRTAAETAAVVTFINSELLGK